MKLAVALLLAVSAQAAVISTTSVYCIVDGQQTTGETKCSEVGPTYWDRVIGEAGGSATISGNTLSVSANASSWTFTSQAPTVPLASGGVASITVTATTAGPARSGWARLLYYESFGAYPFVRSYSSTFDGGVADLPVPVQHIGKLGTPTSTVVPFQLGTEFSIWLHVTSDATFGTGGIFRWAEANLELFEDQALTVPVQIVSAPEPSTWLLVSLPLLFSLRNRLGRICS